MNKHSANIEKLQANGAANTASLYLSVSLCVNVCVCVRFMQMCVNNC